MRGLLANTTTQQQPTQNTDIYERLPGSDETFKSLSNHSTNVSISQQPIAASSQISSSVRSVNGRHSNNLLNSAITPQSSVLPALPQHSFSRSDHLIGGLNRSNSTGASTSSSRQNYFNGPQTSGNLDHNSVNRTVGGSSLSIFGLDDSNSLLRSNSMAEPTGIDASNLHSTAAGVKVLSQNSTDSNDDMYKQMANIR